MSGWINRHRMEELIVQKRERDFRRQEESTARDRYYTTFDRQNTQFRAWTQPQYYRKCEEQLQAEREAALKQRKLQERREKLRALLDSEKHQYKEELRIAEQRKSTPVRRAQQITTDVLAQIRDNLKREEDLRRRKQLEEKLYRHWSFTEGRNLLDSPNYSEHKALAKLSWMDKQVEKQMERERQQKEEAYRQKIQMEKMMQERKELIERERDHKHKAMKLSKYLEMQMADLKQREDDAVLLKIEERKALNASIILEKEQERLGEEIRDREERDCALYNLRSSKLKLKEKAELVKSNLEYNLRLLHKLQQNEELCFADEMYDNMLKEAAYSLSQQLALELQRESLIAAMFDSEANQMWSEQDSKWRQEAEARDRLMFEALETLKSQTLSKAEESINKQKHLVSIKENHIKSIEELNHQVEDVENDLAQITRRLNEVEAVLPTEKTDLMSEKEAYASSDSPYAQLSRDKPVFSPQTEHRSYTSRASVGRTENERDSVNDLLHQGFVPPHQIHHKATNENYVHPANEEKLATKLVHFDEFVRHEDKRRGDALIEENKMMDEIRDMEISSELTNGEDGQYRKTRSTFVNCK